MNKPKFKVGDVIKINKNKIQMYKKYTKGFMQITSVTDLFGSYYYTINEQDWSDCNNPLISSDDIDKSHIIDKVYLRKDKIRNIIYKNKNKLINEESN